MIAVKLPGLEGHDWIDAREAARLLGIQPQSVRALVSRGQLQRHKVGNANVFDSREVERFAARRRPVGRPPKKDRKPARKTAR